jgi:hypothetical protein
MIEQLAIALTTVPAILMTQIPRPGLQKWACWIGLAGQPFWFHHAWSTGSWGVFLTAVAVTLGWLVGIWIHWIRRAPAATPEAPTYSADVGRDKVIFSSERLLTPPQWEAMVAVLERLLSDSDVRVVLLPPGVRLSSVVQSRVDRCGRDA